MGYKRNKNKTNAVGHNKRAITIEGFNELVDELKSLCLDVAFVKAVADLDRKEFDFIMMRDKKNVVLIDTPGREIGHPTALLNFIIQNDNISMGIMTFAQKNNKGAVSSEDSNYYTMRVNMFGNVVVFNRLSPEENKMVCLYDPITGLLDDADPTINFL